MKYIVFAIIIASLIGGCGVIGTYKREVRVAETEAAREVADSALFFICGAPLATVKERLASDSRLAGWYIMCGFDLPSYTLVED